MAEHELISIREAARRLGVSDTAVRKAIKAERVFLAGSSDQGWPLLAWPQARDDWMANSDTQKRSHVGHQGGKREGSNHKKPPLVKLAVSSAPDESGDAEPARPSGAGVPSYAQSRAIREAYQARLAKLEFEQKSGKLISADEVKVAWVKKVKAAQTKILGISAACKSRCPELPLTVVALVDDLCREALEDLANGGA